MSLNNLIKLYNEYCDNFTQFENIISIRIKQMNNKLKSIERKLKIKNKIDFTDHLITINENIISKYLEKRDIKNDLKLLIEYYDNNYTIIPIKYISKNKYKYWNGKIWQEDDGEFIKNTLISKLQKTYMYINTYEKYHDNLDCFMTNQFHINKLSDKKYTMDFFNMFIEYIISNPY